MFKALRVSGCLALLAFVVGCASSAPDHPVAQLHVRQLPASEFTVKQQGATSIAYELSVTNDSGAPLTLKQIEMKTVGRSSYLLRNAAVALDARIDAGKSVTVPFEMWAYPKEGPHKAGATVWVQGVATFATDRGTVTQPFADSFREPE